MNVLRKPCGSVGLSGCIRIGKTLSCAEKLPITAMESHSIFESLLSKVIQTKNPVCGSLSEFHTKKLFQPLTALSPGNKSNQWVCYNEEE